MFIGYFADASKSTTRRTRTHIIVNGKPICGATVKGEAQYVKGFIVDSPIDVECVHCMRLHNEEKSLSQTTLDLGETT